MARGLGEIPVSKHIRREKIHSREDSKNRRWEVLPPREGSEIAKELLEALLANPRFAMLIVELQLGVEGASSIRSVGWTQTNTRILHICPNLKQVEIRGFHPSQINALTEVLKVKSLVSFRISPRDIDSPDLKSPDFRDGVSLKLLELMQGWPKLEAINIEGFRNSESVDNCRMISHLMHPPVVPSFARSSLPMAFCVTTTSTHF